MGEKQVTMQERVILSGDILQTHLTLLSFVRLQTRQIPIVELLNKAYSHCCCDVTSCHLCLAEGQGLEIISS